MRNKLIIIVLSLLLPATLWAQSSSINAFSPYTFRGLGDIHTQGPSYLRAMGGAGVAMRTPTRINYLNPASLSGGLRNSFLINLGLEGQNYYLKNGTGQSSSYNSFNLRDFAIQFPLTGFMGFGVSLTPMSSVGYRVETLETDPDIVADLGRVQYIYEGSGGVNQLKAGLGARIGRRLSVGAEMVYYQGRIGRDFGVMFYPVTAPNNPTSIAASTSEKVSKVYANFGVQFSPLLSTKHVLTVGATWQPGGALNTRVERHIPSGSVWGDTVSYSSQLTDFEMPDIVRVGASYQSEKLTLNADYLYQNWGRNAGLSSGGWDYRNTSTWMAGAEYTPNRLDIRRFVNRLTYRVGVHYSDYYLMLDGRSVTDRAVTFGVGIPLHMAALSNINVGFELGSRGTTRHNLLKENYFKISVGFSLFGEDDWFVKRKYF